MSTKPLDVVRGYIDRMWNAHDLETIAEFVAPDVVYHPPRGPVKGYDGYRAMMVAFLRAFPDLHFDIDGAAEDGDLVALRLSITGTHTGGDHLGRPPSGGAVDVQGRPWFRVRDGKVVEVWSLYDERGMLEQLSSTASPGTA